MGSVPKERSLIDRFIFYPTREMTETPAQWGLEYEDLRFPASDGTSLHGWFVPGAGDVTWLWLHGNGGNVSHRLEDLTLLASRLGLNILLFDYRGYGLSDGRPSERGTYRDAEGALDYLHSRGDIDPHKIVYFGRSLGAAVGVWLACRRAPYGLILESPFASVREMARFAYPRLPLHLLIPNKYDSVSRIGRVSCPVLVLHGDLDHVVPMAQGRKLYEAAREPKRFYVIEGAAHNDTYLAGGEPYLRTLVEFLASLDQPRD